MRKNLLNSRIIQVIAAIIVGALVGLAGGKMYAVFTPTETKVEVQVPVETEGSLELAEEQPPALVQVREGVVETQQIPTVEKVLGNEFGEEEVDLGQGAYYNITSPTAFKEATLGKCIDADGKFGSQCVDLFAVFHKQYTGRWANVCGTGAARGLWACREANAGKEYELVQDPAALQPGDWAIFNGGTYGHVGMVMGPYNKGYVALLGENQGGTKCAGGGAATNVINMSTKTFLGAFRPKIYIQPEPAPEPATEESSAVEPAKQGCDSWTLKKGDTLGKIMYQCEGKIEWGEAMDEYAKTWYSPKYGGQVVYDGWYFSANGVGLYAGDTIVREK